MSDLIVRVVASVVVACLFCFATFQSTGAMQQSGYKNGVFWRWLKRKDNLYFNRLWVWALCLALSVAVVSLCFSFLGVRWALALSVIPFFVICLFFLYADGKFALKVPTVRTGRLRRLFVVYLLLVAVLADVAIALLGFLSEKNGSELYALLAYVPFAVLPLTLPCLLCLANAITAPFENCRNRKFVCRAQKRLSATEITRIGVVGSYGKTSVKHILKSVLEEKYTVVETPSSYNTPIGIAKTITSDEFQNKQIFIAEMGARKAGDIRELCGIVQPDYAIFTGVCEQHVQTFGSIDGVWNEKKEILRCGAKKVVCGASLKPLIDKEFLDAETIAIADATAVENVCLGATKTSFTLALGGEKIQVETPLLGNVAVENMQLVATLALELGLTPEQIGAGLRKVSPIAHRLQLIESGGAYILDDGYNCNPRGADEGISALQRFSGRKCIVTPGIVECGILEERVNARLGERIAKAGLDKLILVGETLVGTVKDGYLQAGGDKDNLRVVKTLKEAQEVLKTWISTGDAVLFLNDLPDVY